jgi:hypothetical protein
MHVTADATAMLSLCLVVAAVLRPLINVLDNIYRFPLFWILTLLPPQCEGWMQKAVMGKGDRGSLIVAKVSEAAGKTY